jgi:hypothetical protein
MENLVGVRAPPRVALVRKSRGAQRMVRPRAPARYGEGGWGHVPRLVPLLNSNATIGAARQRTSHEAGCARFQNRQHRRLTEGSLPVMTINPAVTSYVPSSQ